MPFASPKERRAVFAKGLPLTVRSMPGRVRGWTVPLSPAIHGRNAKQLLRKRFPGKSRAEHEADARRFDAAAQRLQSAWNRHWEDAFQRTHGRPSDLGDYRISGIGDDELPEKDQHILRGLAQAKTRAANLADAHRYAGKHLRRQP